MASRLAPLAPLLVLAASAACTACSSADSGSKGPVGFHTQLWSIVRPAVVALDPTYGGDDAAFCEAFDRNRYAPDLH